MTTVKVRPLSYAEVERLVAGDTLDVYRAEHDGLVQATLTRDRKSNDPVHPTEVIETVSGERRQKIKGSEPVGYRVHAEVKTQFGISTGATFYTSLEAEKEADLSGNYSYKGSRDRLNYGVQDDENGVPQDLVPVYGSQVSLTMFLADVDHEDALERALKALHAEFGDDEDLVRIHRPSSRPVRDTRVNVFTFSGPNGEERLVAADVLEAEASYYANASTFRTILSSADDEPQIKVGPRRRGTLHTDASGRTPR